MDSYGFLIKESEANEEKFKSLIRMMRNRSSRGFTGDVKLDYLSQLADLAKMEPNRAIMLSDKYELMSTINDAVFDSNPNVVNYGCQLAVNLSIDASNKKILLKRSSGFIPAIAAVLLNNNPDFLQSKITATRCLCNVAEDKEAQREILHLYEGLNLLEILINLVNANSEAISTHACSVLHNLMSDKHNIAIIGTYSEGNVLKSLSAILLKDYANAKKYSIRMLFLLSTEYEDKRFFFTTGAIASLLQYLKYKDAEDTVAFSILFNISSKPEDCRRLVDEYNLCGIFPSFLSNNFLARSASLIFGLLLNISSLGDDTRTIISSGDHGILHGLLECLRNPSNSFIANVCGVFLNICSNFGIRQHLLARKYHFIESLLQVMKKNFSEKCNLFITSILNQFSSQSSGSSTCQLSYDILQSILPVLNDFLLDCSDISLRTSISMFLNSLSDFEEDYIARAFMEANIVPTMLHIFRKYSQNPSLWTDKSANYIISALLNLSNHPFTRSSLIYYRACFDLAPILEFKGVEIIKVTLFACNLLGQEEPSKVSGDPSPLLKFYPQAFKVLLATVEQYTRQVLASNNASPVVNMYSIANAVLSVCCCMSNCERQEVLLLIPCIMKLLSFFVSSSSVISSPKPVEIFLEAVIHMYLTLESKKMSLSIFLEGKIGDILQKLRRANISSGHKRLCDIFLRHLNPEYLFSDLTPDLKGRDNMSSDKHIVLSYANDSNCRDIVVSLQKSFLKRGNDTWRNETGSHSIPPVLASDFSNITLLRALQNCHLAIFCICDEYKRSAYSRLEALLILKMAKQQAIKIVFISFHDVEEAPEFLRGWVSDVIGSSNCYSAVDVNQVQVISNAIAESLKLPTGPEISMPEIISGAQVVKATDDIMKKEINTVATSSEDGIKVSGIPKNEDVNNNPPLLATDTLEVIRNAEEARAKVWHYLHDPNRLIDVAKLEAKLFELGILEMEDIQFLDSDMIHEIIPFFKPAQRKKILSTISQAQSFQSANESSALLSTISSPIRPISPVSSKDPIYNNNIR